MKNEVRRKTKKEEASTTSVHENERKKKERRMTKKEEASTTSAQEKDDRRGCQTVAIINTRYWYEWRDPLTSCSTNGMAPGLNPRRPCDTGVRRWDHRWIHRPASISVLD